MSNISSTLPEIGDIIPDDNIMYFIKGSIIALSISVELSDRHWHYLPTSSEIPAYAIIKETTKQYSAVRVTLDIHNKVLHVRRPLIVIKKSEMICQRTPGMIQDIGSPVIGLFTFNKDDVNIVQDSMREFILQDMQQLEASINQMKGILN